MKAYIRPRLNRREKERVAAGVEKEILRGITRAQWLMLIAFNEVLGIGAKRAGRVLARYNELLDEFEEYVRDGVEDEMLMRRLRKMGLEVTKLWGDQH